MNDTRVRVDERMHERFARLAAMPGAGIPITRRIAIISTPRSGSTLFCESLGRTGLFGHPEEWMNPRRLKAYGRLHNTLNINVNEYLRHVMARTTTANGVFTLNFHVDQYLYWKNKGLDLLALKFDHLFQVHRKDKLAQAYSYVKAMKSDAWRSEYIPLRKVEPEQIRDSEIILALHHLMRWDEYHASRLDRHVEARYRYEDFAARPEVFREVLERCGIEHEGIAHFDSGLRVQTGSADRERLQALRRRLGWTD